MGAYSRSSLQSSSRTRCGTLPQDSRNNYKIVLMVVCQGKVFLLTSCAGFNIFAVCISSQFSTCIFVFTNLENLYLPVAYGEFHQDISFKPKQMEGVSLLILANPIQVIIQKIDLGNAVSRRKLGKSRNKPMTS